MHPWLVETGNMSRRLMVPHGFTLSVAGSLAILAGDEYTQRANVEAFSRYGHRAAHARRRRQINR